MKWGTVLRGGGRQGILGFLKFVYTEIVGISGGQKMREYPFTDRVSNVSN